MSEIWNPSSERRTGSFVVSTAFVALFVLTSDLPWWVNLAAALAGVLAGLVILAIDRRSDAPPRGIFLAGRNLILGDGHSDGIQISIEKATARIAMVSQSSLEAGPNLHWSAQEMFDAEQPQRPVLLIDHERGTTTVAAGEGVSPRRLRQISDDVNETLRQTRQALGIAEPLAGDKAN